MNRQHRATHYRKNEAGDFQCGGHVRTKARPEDHSDTTTDPWLVTCARCEGSPVVKAASKAKGARKQAHRVQVTQGGFDPEKPLSEMTREEVMAFIAWREEQDA